jgi:hypothetical protein
VPAGCETWAGVRGRAQELLESPVSGRNYAMTEIVHCGSWDEGTPIGSGTHREVLIHQGLVGGLKDTDRPETVVHVMARLHR